MKPGRQPWQYRRHIRGAGTGTLAPRDAARRASTFDRIRYRIDNAFSRGTWAIISWLAAITATVILTAALVLTFSDQAAANDDSGLLEALWQSMLRVIDPGTMSADNGWLLRVVALLVTVSGIFLASALIGIIATGIDRRLEDLRKGRSFVVEHGHTLILGWSSRLFVIVSEIVEANSNLGKRCIVVLADEDKVEMEDLIRARVGDTRNTRIVCRRGDPTNPNDLDLVNIAGARAVVILGGDEGDAGAVKATLAVMARDPDLERSHVVVELNDERNADILRDNASGRVLPVNSAAVIAGVTAQACRQTGLAAVYQELLDFEGDEVYFQVVPELEGHTFRDALLAFDTSAVLGVATADGGVRINPSMTTTFAPGDQVIAISQDDDTIVFTGVRDPVSVPVVTAEAAPRGREELLVIGWNGLGPRILQELDQFVTPGSAVEVLVEDEHVDEEDLTAAGVANLTVVFTALKDEDLVTVTATSRSFDHVILLGYRKGMTPAEADARTLLTLLQLHRCLTDTHAKPRIVAELLDSRDVELGRVTAADDLIVSDVLSSLMMAQLAERPELDAVFRDLFDVKGSSIMLRPLGHYLPVGRHTFAEYVAAAAMREEVAIGYRRATGGGLGGTGVVLNPAKRATVDEDALDLVLLSAGVG